MKVPKSSSEKWRRKLHIKFRRFRLNIRTSVIRNDFLLSRSILAAAFVLEEITLSSELCFPKIGKSFSLSIFVDSVQEWMGIKKHLEKAVILLLWRTFQFTSTVFCSTGLRILERLFFLVSRCRQQGLQGVQVSSEQQWTKLVELSLCKTCLVTL